MTKTSLSLSFLLLLVKDSWAALHVHRSESLVTPKVIEINGPFGQCQSCLGKDGASKGWSCVTQCSLGGEGKPRDAVTELGLPWGHTSHQ